MLAVLAISTGAPFARWAAPAPALVIAALRVGFAAVLLFAIAGKSTARIAQLAPRERPMLLAAGIALALHFGAWIASLSFTSVAASTALVSLNPVFAALLGALLGDKVARREWLGIAIAALGCAMLAGGDWRAGGTALVGDALAVLGAACGAAYLVLGRRLRAALPLMPYLGAVNAIAAVALGVAAIASGASLGALPAQSIIASVFAAVIASVVGHSLLNAAVRTTPTHLVALAILGEPLGSSLITWLAFGERPPAHAALGGAVVLAGIALGFVRRATPATVRDAREAS